MKCLFLGVEVAAFELGVCSGGERFVSDQDLEKALAVKVFETFDGVENLSADRSKGMELQILYAATMCWRFYQQDTGNHCYFN